MRLLGLSPLDKDATVAAVEDGRLLFAAAEERFSRVKQHAGFPEQALAAALAHTGWRPRDVDAVCYPFLEAVREAELIAQAMARDEAVQRGLRDDDLPRLLRQADERARATAAARRAAGLRVHGLADCEQRLEKGLAHRVAHRLLALSPRLSALASRRLAARWAREAVAGHAHWERELHAGLERAGFGRRGAPDAVPLRRGEHHAAHAAGAFLLSGFERALVVTLDGYGSGLAGSISLGERDAAAGGREASRDGGGVRNGGEVRSEGARSGGAAPGEAADVPFLRRLDALPFPHSLGSFFEHVTSSLGFHPDRHAGKIVGLAAYGDPELLEEALLSRVSWESGAPRGATAAPAGPGAAMHAGGAVPRRFRLAQPLNVHLSRHLAGRYAMIDVAAAWQRVLERLACEWVGGWLAATGCDALVLSGGVAANVKLNQRLHALPGVRRLFVDPDMGDGGTAAGLALAEHAAAYATAAATPARTPASGSPPGSPPGLPPGPLSIEPLRDVYLGPAYDDAQFRAALERGGLAYERPADLAGEVARRLHDGQVVARFDGRMEYGPRALGNRSILYPASRPDVNQWLNQRLGRTEFMPFAPITRAHAAARCYAGLDGAERAAEFMTVTFDCTPWMRERSPAAVHVDGTARPQLLRPDANPGCDAILAAYEKLSGLPTLVNTSFNMHEEPIVCSPEDAVRAFRLGRPDALVLGPYLAAVP